MQLARAVTQFLTGKRDIGEADEQAIQEVRHNIASLKAAETGSIVEALVSSGLANSNTDARRFIQENAISINGQKVQRELFEPSDFHNGRLLLRRGKAYKDSALIEQ
jgi:tyrosyl-tRNA synthetase